MIFGLYPAVRAAQLILSMRTARSQRGGTSVAFSTHPEEWRTLMATILLVEDEHYIAKAIRQALEQAGYQTLWVADKTTALDLHAHHRIDLVILDWMLPGFSRLDMLRQTSNTPVLVLTSPGEDVDPVVALEAGADAYLAKPYTMGELIARVRALLRRAELAHQIVSANREAIGEHVRLGPLHLDLTMHMATLDDVPLALSRTEFALLQLLMFFPERVMSRSYLIEAVWSATYMGGDRSVDNTVLRLRKKLGKLGNIIETVWGIGYRMRSNI
jgi:DNA-binding response OmpR family regulator